MPAYMRGARPSPRHRLAGSTPHRINVQHPTTYSVVPQNLQMWDNATDGCCVTSEECFAKLVTGQRITDAVCKAWASAHGVLNGATLIEVLDAMSSDGIKANDGTIYRDGPHNSVDWTVDDVLSNAIYLGPVKIGVAASQLENAVNSTGGRSGWLLTGGSTDQALDHCVSLCGYGPLSYLAAALGVPLPVGANPSAPGYLLFTWQTIGIIDQRSMIGLTGEAWLRNPTTVGVGPTPPPLPPPPPPVSGIPYTLSGGTVRKGSYAFRGGAKLSLGGNWPAGSGKIVAGTGEEAEMVEEA